jgi:hypothetical protein
VRKSAARSRQTSRSQGYDSADPAPVIKVRTGPDGRSSDDVPDQVSEACPLVVRLPAARPVERVDPLTSGIQR